MAEDKTPSYGRDELERLEVDQRYVERAYPPSLAERAAAADKADAEAAKPKSKK
jgi:hypothetical protein